MAQVPGLVAKIWLKAPDGSAYGGVYPWRDRDAYEAFCRRRAMGIGPPG
jgi:hypothetical protein